MKGEAWNRVELAAAIDAMRAFENRCNEISARIGEKKRLEPYERSELEQLYKALKSDLGAAAKCGTLSGRREIQTRIESAFYDPAVRKAHIALRPATNSNPLTSKWVGALWEAGSEFSYFLHQMEGLLKEP